jgi:hypothetical protein
MLNGHVSGCFLAFGNERKTLNSLYRKSIPPLQITTAQTQIAMKLTASPVPHPAFESCYIIMDTILI